MPAKHGKTVLRAVLLMAFLSILPAAGRAAGLLPLLKKSDILRFYNLHTHETLELNPASFSAQEEISSFMRDFRTGSVRDISPDLIALLADIRDELQDRYPEKNIGFHVISGYRSPKTNAMLRAAGGGQGKDSRHMHGDAADIRVPGVPIAELRDVAWCLRRGGVGFYPGSNFVHVDTHRVRFWNWNPRRAGVKCKEGA